MDPRSEVVAIASAHVPRTAGAADVTVTVFVHVAEGRVYAVVIACVARLRVPWVTIPVGVVAVVTAAVSRHVAVSIHVGLLTAAREAGVCLFHALLFVIAGCYAQHAPPRVGSWIAGDAAFGTVAERTVVAVDVTRTRRVARRVLGRVGGSTVLTFRRCAAPGEKGRERCEIQSDEHEGL